MKIVTVHLPEAYVEALDELVKRRMYPNRAEAIRMAVRDFIRREGYFLAKEDSER
jgi:Arc/MetJ-type ribon-helix-helix transcriptional regulator